MAGQSMSSRIHLIVGDSHCIPGQDLSRFDWLSQLIMDINPDVVVHLGDHWDMASLCSYDRGLKTAIGRNYKADIEVGLEANERIWSPIKKRKKKLPRRITLIGNHEQRIERAINIQPELEGTIGYGDLNLERWYDTTVPYDGNTPGIIEVDGILYSHYFTSGVLGKPVSSEHPAYTLIQKKLRSCTMGHSHIFDFRGRTDGMGRKIMGCIAPCYITDRLVWAGNANDTWDRGVIIKDSVEDGSYNITYISMEKLEKVYGSSREDG